jgi:HAD superfamily hydrolase (TIGR01548 family)
MPKPTLVFDMDGVLVDVAESYRETIARTAAFFTGQEVSRERIQDYKLRGGFNDDWKLTQRIVSDAGVEAPLERIRERFQEIFLGQGGDGLMLREKWIARPGLLERLSERFRLAVFTGRPRAEAEMTLARLGNGIRFDPLVAMEDVRNPKPHPEGLLRIVGSEAAGAFYLGDTVDDAQCARAARVRFIGVVSPAHPRYVDTAFLFAAAGAYAIVDDINHLEEAFAE